MEIPEIPKLNEDQVKINELTNLITNLEFFSNQRDFKIWVFNKLNSIETKLDGKN